MRELIQVFNGNEIALGMLLATWLLWTAVGSGLSVRRRIGATKSASRRRRARMSARRELARDDLGAARREGVVSNRSRRARRTGTHARSPRSHASACFAWRRERCSSRRRAWPKAECALTAAHGRKHGLSARGRRLGSRRNPGQRGARALVRCLSDRGHRRLAESLLGGGARAAAAPRAGCGVGRGGSSGRDSAVHLAGSAMGRGGPRALVARISRHRLARVHLRQLDRNGDDADTKPARSAACTRTARFWPMRPIRPQPRRRSTTRCSSTRRPAACSSSAAA